MTHRERHEAEGLFTLKVKPGSGLCLVKGCRRNHYPGKLSLCPCHAQYRWRMRSKKQSAFQTLRDHARERGLSFTISFDYFQGLCDAFRTFDTEAESRGEKLTIDRIVASRGYEPGNLTILTWDENQAKGNRERHLPAYVQAILERKRAKTIASENPYARDPDACPF